MHPVLIHIGKLNVYSWGFMLAVAVIIAIIGISRLFAREGYKQETAMDIVIATVIAGILGGRIVYVIAYQWQEFIQNPAMMFNVSNGGFSGLVWYGGLLGGFAAFTLFVLKKGLPFWKLTDIFAPFAALGYAIVRIGCFLNGCCYGKVTNSSLGVVFPYVDNLTRHPTQLYGTAFNLLLFIFLISYYQHRRFNGQIFLLYLMGYSVYRFVVEFFRETEIMYGMFTMGQVYTVVLFLLALSAYVWRILQVKKAKLYRY